MIPCPESVDIESSWTTLLVCPRIVRLAEGASPEECLAPVNGYKKSPRPSVQGESPGFNAADRNFPTVELV